MEGISIIKGFRVMLLPNDKQASKMLQTANCARYAYNWAVALQMNTLSDTGAYLPETVLRKMFTDHKGANAWLYGISNNATKQAIRDASDAFWRFVSEKKKPGYRLYSKNQIAHARRIGHDLRRYGMQDHPKFKKKGKSKISFYADPCKIAFTETHVRLEKIADGRKNNRAKVNWIRLAECGRIPLGTKYINPRIKFDGIHWWVSVGVECDGKAETPTADGIGIDVGIKDLAVCSDGGKYHNINKTETVRKLEKKKRRLQRSVSRKYQNNKEGGNYCKTSNIIKSEIELLKINQRLSSIRLNHAHHTTSEIIDRKPKFVAIEDLNVRGMMSNRHLSKAIQNQELAEFSRQIKYKAAWSNIPVVLVNRFFPSSKICVNCGCIKQDLKLSDRTFVCPECGNEIDRDYQAALNLREYGRRSVA